MNTCLGFCVHSGWAALVAIGPTRSGEPEVRDRRRVELVAADEESARQPYHAAEELPLREAEKLVARAVASARRHARAAIADAVARAKASGDDVVGCAVVVGTPMPPWSVADILAVHFRMHQAEGALFRDALLQAGEACRLRVVAVRERDLVEDAAHALRTSPDGIGKRLADLGRSVGPPWGKDQKAAALAAWIALSSPPAKRRGPNRSRTS